MRGTERCTLARNEPRPFAGLAARTGGLPSSFAVGDVFTNLYIEMTCARAHSRGSSLVQMFAEYFPARDGNKLCVTPCAPDAEMDFSFDHPGLPRNWRYRSTLVARISYSSGGEFGASKPGKFVCQ